MSELDKAGHRNTEKRKAAARENGKKGGRLPDPGSTNALARKLAREEVLAGGRWALSFLLRLAKSTVLIEQDEQGNEVRTPISVDVRERAAGRVLAKGLPDELLLAAAEDQPIKLVDVLRWKDEHGVLHEADQEIPGPETVQ